MIHLANLLDNNGLPQIADQIDRKILAMDIVDRAQQLLKNKPHEKWMGIRQCMQCRKVYHEDVDEWLPHKKKIDNATHGLCPECKDKILKK